jgi:hypothetical protein
MTPIPAQRWRDTTHKVFSHLTSNLTFMWDILWRIWLSARQRHAKTHSHVNEDSTMVSIDTSTQQTGIPWKSILGITRRFRYNRKKRPKHEILGVVASIPFSRSYKREFNREFKRFIRKRIQKAVQESIQLWVYKIGITNLSNTMRSKRA